MITAPSNTKSVAFSDCHIKGMGKCNRQSITKQLYCKKIKLVETIKPIDK